MFKESGSKYFLVPFEASAKIMIYVIIQHMKIAILSLYTHLSQLNLRHSQNIVNKSKIFMKHYKQQVKEIQFVMNWGTLEEMG